MGRWRGQVKCACEAALQETTTNYVLGGMTMTVLESFSLARRTALVTGATRGLGRAFARALAEAGADVVVHGRDAAAAEEVRGEIESLGRAGHVVLGELTTRASVDEVVHEAISRAGTIDVLVNNAGTCVHRPALGDRRRVVAGH